MADKPLESFKIADKHKPRVKATAATSPTAKVQEEPLAESQTFGFARIEAILDKEPPSQVSRTLTAHREALKELELAASTPKERSSAKKAQLAIDRTADLLDYLFRTKAAMLAPLEQADAAQKATASKRGKARHKDKK